MLAAEAGLADAPPAGVAEVDAVVVHHAAGDPLFPLGDTIDGLRLRHEHRNDERWSYTRLGIPCPLAYSDHRVNDGRRCCK